MNTADKMKGLFLLVLSLSVVGVSAYVYQQANQSVTHTVLEIATITLKDPALGNIREGNTVTYTKAEVSNLGDAITLTTTTNDVNLHLDSNLDDQSTTYSQYDIVVKYATVPGGSHSVGETAVTLTIASPTSDSILLDSAGTWTFDFEITTHANSVDDDTPTSVDIIVTAESS